MPTFSTGYSFGATSNTEYYGTTQAVGATTYGNLTINQSSGNATLGGAATVNGILTLTAGNLAVTDPNVLTMGASATTTGATDVTGIVKRTTLVATTSYTFGNQYTTIMFRNAGTLPTDMSVKITIGSAPAWKTGAVQRTYDIIQTGASGSVMTIGLHYLDAELNGNTENKLVVWSCQTPFTPGTAIEYGRSNYDTTNNWVATSTLAVSYFPTAFGSKAWTLGDSALPNATWNGSSGTDWTTPANWTPSGVPSDLSDVVIPDASTTPNDPTLGLTLAVGRLTINSGGILNSADSSTVTISSGTGAWSNNGGTLNAGTSTVVFTSDNATMSGATDFYNVTINPGASLLMQSGGTMRIGGTMTNNGTWRVAALANTVEYNGGSQTVLNPNGPTPGYNSLILSGSGTKTMPGTALSISGNFSMSGTASATAGAAINTTGSFTVGSGTSFTTGAYTHTIGGNFSNSGTFTATGSTITLNGSASQAIGGANTTAFNNLTINNTNAAVSANTNFSAGGTLTVDSSAVLNPAAAVVISGAGTLTGNGTVNVTRTAATADFSSQYTISNKTLTNLTAAYVGSAAQTVSALTYGGLKINNANGVTLGGNATVNGTLTLTSGKITTGSNTMIINSSGSVTGGSSSSYIFGNLQKNVATGATSGTFEVGATYYNPVNVVFSNVSSAGNLTARATFGQHANIGTCVINSSKDVNVYWSLTNSGVVFDSYGVTLNFVSGDIIGGANFNNFIVGRYSGGWTYPTVGTKTPTSTQATGITSFSDFVLGEPTAPPTVTTDNATNITATGATLNGNLTSLGSATSDNVSFVWGTTQGGPYPNETTPQVRNTTGTFSDNVTGLSPNTTYYFKAKAVGHGTSYGAEKSFTTATVPPTVTTDNATNITATGATLNGNLTSLGSYSSVYVFFQYGLNTSYGTNTTEQAKTATGGFSDNITGLSKGTPYHFRAVCRYNSDNYTCGEDKTLLTKPDPPTGFTATPGNGQVSLSWTKGAGANMTIIIRKVGGYPANRTDGTQVYFDTGTSYTDTGLTNGTTYYYSAWSEVSGSQQFSDDKAQAQATPMAPPSPGGGGGGGGGGGVGRCPLTLTINMLGETTTATMTLDGVLCESCVAVDPSRTTKLELDKGTKVNCPTDKPFQYYVPRVIEVSTSPESPPPDSAVLASLVYNITGYPTVGGCRDCKPTTMVAYPVTFHPGARLVMKYELSKLPKGVSALAIAYYDTKQGWVELERGYNGVAEVGTITAEINQSISFALLAQMAPPPPPPPPSPAPSPPQATFKISNLTISPSQVSPGEPVIASVQVTNSGGAEGVYRLSLITNGVTEATREIRLTPGDSQLISFTTTKDKPGTYHVVLDNLSGKFSVTLPVIYWIITTILAITTLIIGIAVGFNLAGRRKWLGEAKAPQARLPAIKLPRIKLPRIKLPRIKLPKLTLLKIKLFGKERPKTELAKAGKISEAEQTVPLATIAELPKTSKISEVEQTVAIATITDLQIMPDQVITGSNVSIIVNVTNNSQITIILQEIELKINGKVEAAKKITFLSPGESRQVTFVITADAPSDYEVDIAGVTGKFSVMPAADTVN